MLGIGIFNIFHTVANNLYLFAKYAYYFYNFAKLYIFVCNWSTLFRHVVFYLFGPLDLVYGPSSLYLFIILY